MRRTAAMRALTGVAFASATVFACGDGAAPAAAPAWTSSIPPVETRVPTEESSYTFSDSRITDEVVEGILPSSAETSATLGLSPGSWALKNPGPWGQELEGMDLNGSGIIAGWAAALVPLLTPAAGAATQGIALSITFHGTADEAERTYQYIRGAFGIQPGEGDERQTIADAVSMIPAYGVILIRQRTVTVMMVGMGAVGGRVSAGPREFARMLALGIDEFVRSRGP